MLKGLLVSTWPGIPFLFGIACYLLLLRRSQARILRGAENAGLTNENQELSTDNQEPATSNL